MPIIVDCLVNFYGNKPIFLLKTFSEEKFANEAVNGLFYANSIDWFRQYGNKGQHDPNESIISQSNYFALKENSNLKPKDIINVYDGNITRNKDMFLKECSLVCFSGLFLDDCYVIKWIGYTN